MILDTLNFYDIAGFRTVVSVYCECEVFLVSFNNWKEKKIVANFAVKFYAFLILFMSNCSHCFQPYLALAFTKSKFNVIEMD